MRRHRGSPRCRSSFVAKYGYAAAMDILEVAVVRREIEREFPLFTVVEKENSSFMRLIGFLLKVVTFGKMTAFMTSFTTTIGWTMYVSSNWSSYSPLEQAVTMRHERVHLRQQQRYSRVGFALLYLFAFLPLGLAWFRARFEMEAYTETLKAYRQYGADITGPALRASIISQFTSANYGWMWPFRTYMEHWYDSTVQKLLSTSPTGVSYDKSNSGTA